MAKKRRYVDNFSVEKLEQRLALAADGVFRPQLERSATLVIDAAAAGPFPVEFAAADIVENSQGGFIVTNVAMGSVVEKWDPLASVWREISVRPRTSNPSELLQLLNDRVIRRGDKIRWSRLGASESHARELAFGVLPWQDGRSGVTPDSSLVPGAVGDLVVSSAGDGELTASWTAPISGESDVHYRVLKAIATDSGTSRQIIITTDTSLSFTDQPEGTYTFTVTPINNVGAGPATSAETSFTNFRDLVKQFSGTSLETVLKEYEHYVRHEAHSDEGKVAVELYGIAVEVMKSLPASNPYSWAVQAGIHGTFWTNLGDLRAGMIEKGYVTSEQADVIFGTPENPASWETVLNNCNHWASLWLEAQGRKSPGGAEQAGPTPSFSSVFIAWHRLYLAAFEKCVRQVLISEKASNPGRFLPFANMTLANAKVEVWALPYWDYRDRNSASIPPAFQAATLPNGEPNPLHQPSLYEAVRGVAINNGASFYEITMPEADLEIVDIAGSENKNITVGDYINKSIVLQQSQAIFTAFNSNAERSPHALAHDVIGGLTDSNEDKLDNWIKMAEMANAAFSNIGEANFWESHNTLNTTMPYHTITYLQKLEQAGKTLPASLQFQKDTPFLQLAKTVPDSFLEIAPTVLSSWFGVGEPGTSSEIAPSVIGWVPTAAQDPVFWLHHALVDKLWSEYNQMPSASYLSEDLLDLAGWNFTFWEPGSGGEPELKVYSTWKNSTFLGEGAETITSSKVIAACYYPTYSYFPIQPRDVNYSPIDQKPNSLLALLEDPSFSPALNVIEPEPVANTITALAGNPINLEMPINAGVVKEFRTERSNDINVAVEIVVNTPMWASENIGVVVGDLEFLKINSQAIEDYWQSWEDNRGLGGRDGKFLPESTWYLEDLDGNALSFGDSQKVIGRMQLARFNPLAMASGGEAGAAMRMTSHYTAEISNIVVKQFSLNQNIIEDASALGIMLLSHSAASAESTLTTISQISTSLHQNINESTQADDFDAMAYLIKNIESLANNGDALKDLFSWYSNHGNDTQAPPTYYGRASDVAYVYMATNPSLISTYYANPLGALEHYLTNGMREGLSLDGWARSDDAASGEGSVFQKAREFVLAHL